MSNANTSPTFKWVTKQECLGVIKGSVAKF